MDSQDWEEHTEIVPRVRLARRRQALVFLVIGLVALSAAGATTLAGGPPRVSPATRDAIAATAQQLGMVIEAGVKKTHDRAEGFAGTPVLEVGIVYPAQREFGARHRRP